MKYLFSWLQDYYQTDKTIYKLADDLVSLGSEADDVSGFPAIDDGVVTVKIDKIEPHPNADRLRLATVSDGSRQIKLVCGAPNIEVGQVVPMAKVGSKVLDFEIKEAEIRGVKSPGMLLSPRELGISKEHAGVHIFPDNCAVGEKVSNILSADYVIDLEITPNRGDLLSHFGLARDLSAKDGVLLDKEKIELKESSSKSEDFLEVDIKTKLCPLYLARVIRGVKISPSPIWLKERLIALGAKPINNVVDITNYIMLDLGQPLHAFDASKTAGKKIIVKELENDIDVVTLDGEARAAFSGSVVISDVKEPIAIAGVMGLKNSEVDEKTTDIILEAAVFDRKSIRKTRRLMSIQTEASYRFERGVDMGGVRYALDKAAKLIQDIAGGEILSGVVKAGEEGKPEAIKIEYEKINSLLGLEIDKNDTDKILKSLGFKIKDGVATVPTWRHDIDTWQDFVEEVGRMYGLDKIKPQPILKSEERIKSDYHKKEGLKDYLVELGLCETINYTFLSDLDISAALIETANLAEVANPVQEENKYLRNSLVPGLLKAVAKNPSFDDIELFEIGKVFSREEEWTSFTIVTAGKQARSASDLVGMVCDKFGFKRDSFNCYEIAGEDLRRFKIKKPSVSIAEANLDELLPSGTFDRLDLASYKREIKYRPISKFPSVTRDLAFTLEKEIKSSDLKNGISEASGKAVLVELFDEFESDKIGPGMKSVAFHIHLEDETKTLSDVEAEAEIQKIISFLRDKFGARVRA